MSVDPYHCDPSMPPYELPYRPDVGAAATAEHQRAGRQLPAHRGDLRVQRVLGHDGRLGPWQVEQRRLRHRLAPVTPRTRHAQQPCGKLAAARMALVLGADGNRGQRPAVGTPRPQRAHASDRSNTTAARCTRIPARS